MRPASEQVVRRGDAMRPAAAVSVGAGWVDIYTFQTNAVDAKEVDSVWNDVDAFDDDEGWESTVAFRG